MSERALRITGAVASGRLVEAAGSGRRCAVYQVALAPLQRLLEPRWRQRPFHERAGCWFTLHTTTREPLVIDPRRALLAWRPERLRLARIERSTAARCAALYGRLGREPPPARGELRLREWRIEPGERVEVTGWLGRVATVGGEAGYRAAPTAAVLRARLLRKLTTS